MKSTSAYTHEQRKVIEKLASIGYSDKNIAKETGISSTYVQKISTEYWKTKMEEAYPEKENN